MPLEEAKKPFMSRKELIWLAVLLVFLIAGFIYDEQILENVIRLRTPFLNDFMAFMTNLGLFYATGILAIYLIIKGKYKELALILITVALSMESGFILKKIFQKPRPFMVEALSTITLAQTMGYAFPSLHATFCLSIWPFLQRIFAGKKILYVCALAIITIIFSRMYVGVHYMSDLIAGGVIGFLFARLMLYLQDNFKVIEWFVFHVKDKFELRRQIAHLLTGLSIVILLKYKILSPEILFGVLVLGGIVSIISRKYRIPVIWKILKFFERPNVINYFPGKGSFFLVLGSLLTLVLFPRDIALAAITIMAVGDAITTVIGTYFGKIKNPLCPSKHLEGTIMAIILSTIAAFSFVSFEKAFLGAVAGMAFESLTVRFFDRIIDDNILIPLVAAIAMIWIS
jgi:undecaprenyl-diphosphatase